MGENNRQNKYCRNLTTRRCVKSARLRSCSGLNAGICGPESLEIRTLFYAVRGIGNFIDGNEFLVSVFEKPLSYLVLKAPLLRCRVTL